jgi:hypothetical protein
MRAFFFQVGNQLRAFVQNVQHRLAARGDHRPGFRQSIHAGFDLFEKFQGFDGKFKGAHGCSPRFSFLNPGKPEPKISNTKYTTPLTGAGGREGKLYRRVRQGGEETLENIFFMGQYLSFLASSRTACKLITSATSKRGGMASATGFMRMMGGK